jgi:hypothetical protein
MNPQHKIYAPKQRLNITADLKTPLKKSTIFPTSLTTTLSLKGGNKK